MQKDEFYDELATLVHEWRDVDIILLADDCNAQVEKPVASEGYFGGSCALPIQRTDNGEWLLQVVQTIGYSCLLRIFDTIRVTQRLVALTPPFAC